MQTWSRTYIIWEQINIWLIVVREIIINNCAAVINYFRFCRRVTVDSNPAIVYGQYAASCRSLVPVYGAFLSDVCYDLQPELAQTTIPLSTASWNLSTAPGFSGRCRELAARPQICINIPQMPYLLFTPYHIM